VIDWDELLDAYGSAVGIPALLEQAASTPDIQAPVWGELWGRLCHQGTVYPASFAALPLLADMAVRMPIDVNLQPLFLAASILAGTNEPELSLQARQQFPAELAALRDLAVRLLDLTSDPTGFVYALQAVAAFENLGSWPQELTDMLDDEICDVWCPACGGTFDLEREGGLGDPGAFKDSIRGSSVVPAFEAGMTGASARLIGLAREHDQVDVAAGLLELAGTIRCPLCGAPVPLVPGE